MGNVSRVNWGPHNRRSDEYENYRATQSPQRRKELDAAERAYASGLAARLFTAEQVFQEAQDGYQEAPAGLRTHESDLSYILSGSMNGDWSWKPERDKRLGDKMKTYGGPTAGAAELYRAKGFPRS